MIKYLVPVLAFSVITSACKERAYNSEVANSESDASRDMVTIHLESANVGQPMIFASVDSSGECRGGNPKYRVDKASNAAMPDLKIDLSIKRVCVIGQAGGGRDGGQDVKYWDLPPGLKKGQTLIIKGDKILVSGENGTQSETPSVAFDGCYQLYKPGSLYPAFCLHGTTEEGINGSGVRLAIFDARELIKCGKSSASAMSSNSFTYKVQGRVELELKNVTVENNKRVGDAIIESTQLKFMEINAFETKILTGIADKSCQE